MLLVKAAGLPGAKRTRTFVVPEPGASKDAPERIVNGPPLMDAAPLVIVPPPMLESTKLAVVLLPTVTAPKLRLEGETPSWLVILAGLVIHALKSCTARVFRTEVASGGMC